MSVKYFLQTLFAIANYDFIGLFGEILLAIHGKGEIYIYSQNDTFTKILIYFETWYLL